MNRDLLYVGGALMTWGIGEGMFLSFQSLYLQKLGADPVAIGGILGMVAVALSVAHIPAGYLSDHLGRRPLLLASWTTGLASCLVMALANSLPVFVAGMLLYSLTSFVMAPLNSYTTAARGKLSVGRAMTLVSAFYNAGAILGPALGGLLGDRIGLRQVYFISAAVFVFSNLIIFQIRPQPLEPHVPSSGRSTFSLSKPYLAYLAVIFLVVFAGYMPQPLSPNYLHNIRSLTFTQIGQLGSLTYLAIVVMNLVLGRLEARLGFLIAQASVAMFALFLWKGDSMPWFITGYLFLGGFRTGRTLASAQTRHLVQPKNMGLAFGITETILSSAAILAAPIAGLLYQQDPLRIYSFSLALIVAAFVASLFILPMFKEAPVRQEAAGLAINVKGPEKG